MRGAGEQILEILVNYEKDGLYSGSTWIGDIVHKVGWAADGRSVRPTLKKLERVGLIELDAAATRRHGGKTCWRPTERGREVDGILRKITASRGGRFRPQSEAGIDFLETAALR